MPLPNRVFLSWDRSLIAAAADRMNAIGRKGQTWDLGNVTLIFPVVRGLHRFRAVMHQQAQDLGLRLNPPKLEMIGQLPELLYKADVELAGEFEQTLAWTQALLQLPAAQREELMSGSVPLEPLGPWFQLGGLLRRMNEDLAADGHRPADVAAVVESPSLQRRWALIAQAHRKYLEVLRTHGLGDPFDHRIDACEQKACRCSGHLILVGCVDMGKLTADMLLATTGGEIECWIGAPEQYADRFDACGRVIPHRWCEESIEVDDRTLISVDDVVAQSAAAVEKIQAWTESDAQERVTIGLTDEGFAPYLETDLLLIGRSCHVTAGQRFLDTPAGRLLTLIHDFILHHTWQSFSALIRHADVVACFFPGRTLEVLKTLDTFHGNHFPDRIDDPLPTAFSQDQDHRVVVELKEQVLAWLSPLRLNTASLATWGSALHQVLERIYGATVACEDTSQRPDVDSMMPQILALLKPLTELRSELDMSVAGGTALEILLQRFTEARMLRNSSPEDVNLAGWLELALDDAPNLIVVGLNHPFVPETVSADPFLPHSLRSELGMADNERRFARDAYYLQWFQHAHHRCALIVGRSGPDGSPTPPSRLLAASPADVVLRRVLALLDAPPHQPQPQTFWDRTTAKTELPIPPAKMIHPLDAISVTAFRDYLACPYRFYLRHILKMRPLSDREREMAANQFGDLVHAAVECFGQSDVRHCTEVAKIEENLRDHLHQSARNWYGSHPRSAIRVQIAQAEKRLRHFARLQADRTASGWLIHGVEKKVESNSGAEIVVPGSSARLALKGRIDRIDYHPATGRWAILDYKTHSDKPLPKHYDQRQQRWIDLQLPLYLFMLDPLGIQAPPHEVQLGYFNLAEKETESGVHIAEFTLALLQSAQARAVEIAGDILAGQFLPQTEIDMVKYDDYEMIMQTGIPRDLFVESDLENSY